MYSAIRRFSNFWKIRCSSVFVVWSSPRFRQSSYHRYFWSEELKRNQKFCQTMVYIPHFFSWVIIYGIVYAFFSGNGFVNGIIRMFGGQPKNFLTSTKAFCSASDRFPAVERGRLEHDFILCRFDFGRYPAVWGSKDRRSRTASEGKGSYVSGHEASHHLFTDHGAG